MKAQATQISGEVKAYKNLSKCYKRTGGKVDAFKQQQQARRWGRTPPLLRNPQSLVSAANLVTEGGITAVVLGIAAGLEPPLAWLLPEWKSTRISDVRRRRADAVPGTTSRRWRGPP
jgi:hypothetical protein